MKCQALFSLKISTEIFENVDCYNLVFFQENKFHISCESSAKQMILMKC